MKKATSKSDPYLRMLHLHWDALTGMYAAFEELAPMMEFDVTSGQIRAYAAKDYLERLTDRTREQTKKQYEEAVAKGDLVVFVRDETERILRSYVFPLEDASPTVTRK
jgi:hypothetical protein